MKKKEMCANAVGRLVLTAFALAVAAFVPPAFAQDFDLNSISSADIRSMSGDKGLLDVIRPEPSKEWTIMVYADTKNGTERMALGDLNEMEMVGSTDKVNVVVQLGGISAPDSGDRSGARRYFVTKDADMNRIGSKMVQDLGKVDMGDWHSLEDFGKWARQAYPAKRHMLIISGLNMGAFPHQGGTGITAPQLAKAMSTIGYVAVLCADAGFMQTAEFAYEVKDSADYLVASQVGARAGGYPYNKILSLLAAKPAIGSESMSRLVVTAYGDHYKTDTAGGEYANSSLALYWGAGLPERLNAFADAVMAAGEISPIREVLAEMDKFGETDLLTFLEQVGDKSRNERVLHANIVLCSYLRLMVRDNSSKHMSTQGVGVQLHLDSGQKAQYSGLAWARDTKWDEMLNWISAQR